MFARPSFTTLSSPINVEGCFKSWHSDSALCNALKNIIYEYIHLDISDCCIPWCYCQAPVHCSFLPRLSVVDWYTFFFASASHRHKSWNTRRMVPNPSNHRLLHKQVKKKQIGISQYKCIMCIGNHVII